VIWSEFDNQGELSSVALDGSQHRVLAPKPYSSGVIVSGRYVYWSMSATKKTGDLICRLDLATPGAQPQTLATGRDASPSFAVGPRLLAWIDREAGAVRVLDLQDLA
jgi:hypothetical protein